MSTEQTDERSLGQRIAETLTIVGGIGLIYKCLIWFLIWRGLATPLTDAVQNRTVIMRITLFLFQNWPFVIFALGTYVLARIHCGPPGSWIAQIWPKRPNLEQLRGTLIRGQALASSFEMPESSQPAFSECAAWDKEAFDLAKIQFDAGAIQHEDFVRFTENWNEAACQEAERRLDSHGYLHNVDGVGRETYRFIFGRVMRLQELLDKVK